MNIYGYSQCYDRYGASAIYSFVGELLTLKLGDYGSAIESIELTAYLRSPTRTFRPTLEGLFDVFHCYLKRLPRIIFRRNLKRVEIHFQSEHFDAHDETGWKPSADKSNRAAGEIADALQLLKTRIKPSDDFQVERFLDDVGKVLSKKIDSQKEWEAISKKAKAKRKAILATKSPWEQLEIDWSHYHPRAREVLDDPFFWEFANDLAPNGNDTGADLLEDYRRWDKRNRTKSPLRFLEQLMRGWDIIPIDWSVTNESGVRRLDKEQPIPLRVCNEAAIALAFAVLKMRSRCPEDVAYMAMSALKRTAILVKSSTLSNDVKAAWSVAIKKMRSKLDTLP